MGPREVMEEELKPLTLDLSVWRPVEPSGLSPAALNEVVTTLIKAKRPLVVTAYLGRNIEAPAELVRLSDTLGVMVHESCPSAVNFPASHWGHQSVFWNGSGQAPALSEADVVLIIDADVPWIPAECNPRKDAKVSHFDVDPLKVTMPLWYIQCQHRYKVDGLVALQQINEALKTQKLDQVAIQNRIKVLKERHIKRKETLVLAAEPQKNEVISVAFLVSTIKKHLPKGSILLNEAISNYGPVCDQYAADEPGTMFTSGAGSLGWGIGSAVGACLALKSTKPGSDAIVLSIIGGWF